MEEVRGRRPRGGGQEGEEVGGGTRMWWSPGGGGAHQEVETSRRWWSPGEGGHQEVEEVRGRRPGGGGHQEVETTRWRSGGPQQHHTHLQLGDHVLLRVVRDALVGEQPSCQVLLVVALEHVLLLHEAEEDHGLVQDGLHLLLRQLHTERQEVSDLQQDGTGQ